MSYKDETIQRIIDCFEEAKRQAIEAINTKSVYRMSFELNFGVDEVTQIRSDITENYV